jgi:hypothetical protein
MAVELNIPTVIAKAKAKVALIEGLLEEQKRNEEEHTKAQQKVRDEREKTRTKYNKELLKAALKQYSNASDIDVRGAGWRSDMMSVEFKLPMGSLDVPTPNLDELHPWPEHKRVEFPKQFRRNGQPVFPEEQLAELRNTISWLECVDATAKFTVSEFNRITANL